MDPIILLGLLLLAALGAPLFAIFGFAAVMLFQGEPNGTATSAAVDVFSERFSDSPTLVTLPLFVFAGYVLAEAGTPRRLVAVSKAWFGWMPGGLAIVCLVASAFFTTFTGGSGITIVAIGGLLYPALISDKYPKQFSLGLITSAGSLGLLFPPSLPIVLYAVVGGILIDKLFIAGLIPGMISVVALCIYAAYQGRLGKIERTPFDAKNAGKALWEAKWEVALPVVLILGLVFGVLRIHEAAAFTALYCLVIEVFVYKDLKFSDLNRIIRESMTMLGAILAILATALGFTGYLIQADVPGILLEWLQQFITTPTMFLLVLNCFLIVVGMLMDIFSAVVVVVPLIIPIATAFGVNPYHLGIIFLLNLEIGYLTPPVGLNLFIASFRFKEPVASLYKAVMPFILILLGALMLVTYIPWFSTVLIGEIEPAPGMGEPMDDFDDEGGGLDDFDDEGGGLDDLDDMSLDDMDLDSLDDLDGLDDHGGGLDDLDALDEGDGLDALDEGDSAPPSDEPIGDLEGL
jgi:tripartite ATP-independent transporter DctM subunit